MKLLVAILLNAVLLAMLLPWLRKQWRGAPRRVRGALLFGLGTRLLIAFATSQHLVRDAHYLHDFGTLLSDQLWVEPAAALRSFWGDEAHFGRYSLVYHGMSNTFFFAKIVAVLNLASLTTPWVNALYFSLFSFVGCWQVAQALARSFPAAPTGAGLLAFVVWPSVVFWSSGITKEAMVLGSGAWLMAVFLELNYQKPTAISTPRWGHLVALAVLMLVHFKMRYFFAMPLLGALAGLSLVHLLQHMGLARRRQVQALVMAGVLAVGAWVATEVSGAFRVNKFTNQVMRIYYHQLAASAGRPHFEYPRLQPTLESIVSHMPEAAANALTRPWLGESTNPVYVGAGLENALVLALLAVALLAGIRGKWGRLPFGLVLVLIIHCAALAILLGLSTPNLGTLHRYRSGLLPYLLLLLLQNEYAAAGLRRLGLGGPQGWLHP